MEGSELGNETNGEHEKRLTRRDFLRRNLRADVESWRDLALSSIGGFLAELEPEPEPLTPLRLAYTGSLGRLLFDGQETVTVPPAIGQLEMVSSDAFADPAARLDALNTAAVDLWCVPSSEGFTWIGRGGDEVKWVAGLALLRLAQVTTGKARSPGPELQVGTPVPVVPPPDAPVDQLDWVSRLYSDPPPPGGVLLLSGPELALAVASGRVIARQAVETPQLGYVPYSLFTHRRMTRGQRHRLLLAVIQSVARRCRQLAASPPEIRDALIRLLPDAKSRLSDLAETELAAWVDRTVPAYTPAPLLYETVAAAIREQRTGGGETMQHLTLPTSRALKAAVYTGDEDSA